MYLSDSDRLNTYMDKLEVMSILTTNLTQDTLQDLFDMEDGMDQLIDGLMDTDDIPLDVWMALELLRDRLDVVRHRTMLSSACIRGVADLAEDGLDNSSETV